MFSIISAIGKNREIGKDGKLVFYIKEDMQFFKKTTMGHKILMGERTFRSLPGVLSGRENYVLTMDPENLPKNVKAVTDLDSFIKEYEQNAEEVFVIGGEMVYKQLLPYAKKIYLTEIGAKAEADTFFPKFKKQIYDKIVLRKGQENGLTYTFVKYIRKS